MSSSGHLALVPRLLGWPYAHLDPGARKSFEVALHAAGAAGLALSLGREAIGPSVSGPAEEARRLALTSTPALVAGFLLRHPIERHLGSARSVAIAQIVAGGALWVADLRAPSRRREDAGAGDELVVGLAQALALAPGVSRAGATLTAARLLGFDRRSAAAISRQASLPVIAGAALLKGVSIVRRPPPRKLALPFAAGAVAALLSTIASRPLLGVAERPGAFGLLGSYRIALGAVAVASDR